MKKKKKNKFDNYKFHCSSLGRLMTNSRSKNSISKTAEQLLLEIYAEEVYGRRYEVSSKHMEKGLWVEQQSLTLFTDVEKKLYVKNIEVLKNRWVTGTPDVITKDEIIDIKSSWNLLTFLKADGSNKDYYAQLQGYMYMTGLKKARLVYCLVNTPDFLIVQEKSRRMYRDGIEDGSKEMDEMDNQVDLEMIFNDIPKDKKVKIFEYSVDRKFQKELREKIKKARKVLNEWHSQGI